MIHRRTSTEDSVLESGLVGLRQRQIYSILYNHGPLTANETWNKLAEQIGRLRFDSNTRARFTELRRMGCIYEVQEVKDPITGKMVIQWDVTDQPPRKPDEPRNKSVRKEIQDIWAAIEALREEVADLRGDGLV